MSPELATWIARAIYAYLALGVLLLPWLHWRGLARLDAAAAHGPWGFRLLISPGLVALWPWLLARARRGDSRPPAERNAHRDRAQMQMLNEDSAR